MRNNTPSGKSAQQKKDVLPPDSAILIDTRIKAGERQAQLRSIANLVLHDPVLTLAFLQEANSTVYAGAPVTDIDGALNRLGIGKILELLSGLNSQVKLDDQVVDMLEVLRYNCRRVSIVSLIIATSIRPNVTTSARVAGLFADLGHMAALMRLGKEYCEIAASTKRKNMPFRLQKDKKIDLNALRLSLIGSKGMPRVFGMVFDPTQEAKATNEVDLRCVVHSAQELIDAYDAGKIETFSPDQGLPLNSTLRLFGVTIVQHQRIYKAVTDYLKAVSTEEAPEGASFLCTAEEEDSKIVGDESTGHGIRVPIYSHASINAKSRNGLQDFFALCEGEKDVEVLKQRATEYLTRSGLFQRTAIVCINEAERAAAVDFSVGLDIAPGTVIPIANSSSPFAAFTVQIKSTKTSTADAPFGVSAYAIGPLDLNQDGKRQVLYADVQKDHILSMESRRVFRLALGLLARSVQNIKNPPQVASSR